MTKETRVTDVLKSNITRKIDVLVDTIPMYTLQRVPQHDDWVEPAYVVEDWQLHQQMVMTEAQVISLLCTMEFIAERADGRAEVEYVILDERWSAEQVRLAVPAWLRDRYNID